MALAFSLYRVVALAFTIASWALMGFAITYLWNLRKAGKERTAADHVQAYLKARKGAIVCAIVSAVVSIAFRGFIEVLKHHIFG